MHFSKFGFVILTILVLPLSGWVSARQDNDTFVIGSLILVGEEGFVSEMAAMGYVEGENTTYQRMVYDTFSMEMSMEEYQQEYERQVQLMLEAGVDIFVTNTDTDAAYLRPLIGDIPIVFARSDDPVGTGAVADLTNPGGMTTGIITNKPHERRLQILTEINPATDKIYYLYSPATLEAELVLQQVRVVAEALNVEVVSVPLMGDPEGTFDAIRNIPDDVDWVFLTPFVFFSPEATEELLAQTVKLQIGISGVTDMPTKGYLVGYGPNLDATGRQAAQIVDRILRGASPADLPVQTAENYLLINLEAAEAINLEIPVGILRQANTIMRPGDFDAMMNDTATTGS